MISDELRAKIRRLFYAEHWRVGTIATQLGVHPDTVRTAVEVTRFVSRGQPRPSQLDPYLPFLQQTLAQYPALRATRLHEMLVERGYAGSVVQTRRLVRRLRPAPKAEAYLRLHTLPGEQGQVDWGHFGQVSIGKTKRALSAFVMVLSWSRALHVLWTLDQTLESFLRGHVEAFRFFGGVPRCLLYDNLKSAVLERYGDVFHFQPRLLELCAHYHFEPRPVAVARGNEKGRVERQIRFLRDRFFAARRFVDVDDLNRQFVEWRSAWAHTRPCPQEPSLTVAAAFEQERERLLPLPAHPFDTDRVLTLKSGKTPYLRFDRNDYSIPHELIQTPLTLVASEKEVRILSGSAVVARHARSYAHGEALEDERHLAALSEQKRHAREGRGKDRLKKAVPGSEAFLQEVVRRGDNLGNTVSQLLRLLDDYGPKPLSLALEEALTRGTARAASVAHLLEQKRRRQNEKPPVPVTLPDRPKVRDLRVTPHTLEAYDELLSRPDVPDPD